MGAETIGVRIKPRAVLDTNVMVSALLFGGIPGRLIPLWQTRRIVPLLSAEVLKEYLKVLSYPKFKLRPEEIRGLINLELLPYVEPVKVSSRLRIVKDDPSDDKFLSLALDGRADYVVSGDKHLLEIEFYRKMRIITAEAFLKIVPAQTPDSDPG